MYTANQLDFICTLKQICCFVYKEKKKKDAVLYHPMATDSFDVYIDGKDSVFNI